MSKTWEELGTEVAVDRSDIQISISEPSFSDHPVLMCGPENKPLSELAGCMKKSRKFPCTNFKIVGVACKKEVMDFLSQHGQGIREIWISNITLSVHKVSISF